MSKVMLSVRVEALLKDALYEEARLENRSAANMLEVLLDERYGRAARNAPDPPPVPTKVQDVPMVKEPATVGNPVRPRVQDLLVKSMAREMATKDGKCRADVAFGTKCKLCGKVH